MVALHDIIRSAVNSTTPGTVNRNNIINAVPSDMPISADSRKVGGVIRNLLDTMLINNQDSRIRISAKKYHDVMLVHVKDSSSLDADAMSDGLQRLQPIARQLGGFIDITSQRQAETTIAFSFPNLQAA